MDSSSAAVDVDCRTASKVFNESEPCPLPLPARFDDRSLLSGFECRRSGPVWTHALPVSPPLSLSSDMHMHGGCPFPFRTRGEQNRGNGREWRVLVWTQTDCLNLASHCFLAGLYTLVLFFFENYSCTFNQHIKTSIDLLKKIKTISNLE